MDWNLSNFASRVLDPKKLSMLHNLQCGLLENSLKLVNPNGGIVIYATCSLSRSQNEEVIDKILKMA
jgi:16S rRNA C967 or C1407 C5-methylase (RsmB/RsmF family)